MSKLFGRKKTLENDSSEVVERDRSSTVLTHTQSLIQESLQLKQKANLEIINVKCVTKDEFKKQPYCTVCFRPPSRQHHCRCCANAVCDSCSEGKINGERACDVCYFRYSNTAEEQRKKTVIHLLERKVAILLKIKQQNSEELLTLKLTKGDTQVPDEATQQQMQKIQAQLISRMQDQLKEIQAKKEARRKELSSLTEQKNRILQSIQQSA